MSIASHSSMTGALHGWTERRSGRDREEMVTEGGKEGRKEERNHTNACEKTENTETEGTLSRNTTHLRTHSNRELLFVKLIHRFIES